MEFNKARDAQDLINGSDEEKAILSEDALRQLSRSLTRLIPKDVNILEDGAFAHIQSMLEDVLQTASSRRLPFGHGAAALNALCGVLEQCSASSEQKIQRLSYMTETWTKAFNIYLTKSDSSKSKPLRRLLLTLTRTLERHPEKTLLLGISTCIATRAIRGQDHFAEIKPAIQALEHWINIGVIDAAEIVQITRPEDLGHSRMKSMKTDNQNSDAHKKQVDDSVQNFALSVLEWMQYPDCAPAVGRFLPIFFKSLEESQSDNTAHTSKDGALPLWISPVKQALERHQELWEVFEIHILPGLLRLGLADVNGFLQSLPFESIQHGKIGSSSVSDIQICLLVAKVAEDSSLKNCYGQAQSTSFDLENLGTSLLEHSYPSVRIAALSLLVSSSTSTKPFRRRVLHHVRRCIPYFHVEVNAKLRNEFIAVMKKLCLRVRNATLALLRHRQDIGHVTRKQASTTALSDPVFDDEGPSSSENAVEQVLDEELRTLEEHLAFRKWYMVFLLQELRPTASYQSHITALKVLVFLTEQTISLRNTSSKSYNDYFGALDEYLPRRLFLRPLTDLLLDPFDDVRQSAHKVFDLHLSTTYFPQISRGADNKADLMDKETKYEIDNEGDDGKASHSILFDLNNAEDRAGSTGRADHADGLGRLYSLLFTTSDAVTESGRWHRSRHLILDHVISTLENEVDIAKKDLLFAVSNMPLHGHLIALRYLVSRTDYAESLHASLHGWEDFDKRIVSVCSGVWNVVKDVLCSDAPEGLDSSEDDFNEQDLGTKDTLSFCWRALKESSLLMHGIVTNIGYILQSFRESTNDYEGCVFGNQAFTQLAELRHRGAFSTVSHTFAACSLLCARSSQLAFRDYPKTLYKLALKSIEENATSLTRRSAGMPAMITGVLAAYPGDTFFDDVVVNLQAMANAPAGADLGSLPQVHALNCLKDIFTDARFGLSTEGHVAATLEIAASCLESQIWNIRNCGLMLFKALLKRLNGGTDTASTKASSSHRRFSHLTYEKYPNLPDLLLRLLRQPPNQIQVTGREVRPTMQAHRVFPALEVIERSGIPSQHQGPFLDALQYYNESPNWSIREKAAKALSLIVDETSIVDEVKSLLAPYWKTQNTLHGRLLRLRFLLARHEAPLFGELLNAYETIASILENSFETLAIQNTCPITAATFLNISADLFTTLVMSNSERIESLLASVLAMEQENIAQCASLALQKSALSRCITLANYVQALRTRPQRNGSPETLRHLSKADLDALRAVNMAMQNLSDENDIAVLRFCSARELRCASDITECSGTNIRAVSKNHRQSDFALALQGLAVGESYALDTTNAEVQTWIYLLSEAGAEHSDLRTRIAAVFSMRAFFDQLLDHGFQLSPDPHILGVYLALYDSLVDDDEDVRDQGAKVVSTLLSSLAASGGTNILSVSPPAAKKRLVHFVRYGYRSSMLLCVESVRRLIGMDSVLGPASTTMQDDERQTKQSRSVVHFRPVANLFIEARTTSTVVFVEEKHNLYIDSVSEAEEWADLLVRLEPDLWPSSLVSELEAWTVGGLAHIVDNLQTRVDGALSPTSKPEVFTLFTRVSLAAKVLIMRHRTQAYLKEKGEEHVCIGILGKLLELGRSKLFHELLVCRIESILVEIGLPVPESGAVAAAES